MTFQVGRITGLNEPTSWDSGGSSGVVVTGSYRASSVTDGLVKRDQILSYPNEDEPVIPIILTGEPRVTGYYRPLRTQLLTDDFTRQKGNLYDYQLELERLSGYAQPMMESIINGALLTNVVTAVVGDVQVGHSVPGSVVEYYNGATGSSLPTRSTEDGNVVFFQGGGLTGTARWYVAPSDFYLGSCRFEQGAALQPVVGRTLVQVDPTHWRLSNGIVRVTPNATAGKLDVSVWTGAAYSTAKTYQISSALSGLINGFTSVTVLRNSTEECVIRLGSSASNGIYWGRVFLDLSLKRGDRIVRIYLTSDQAAAWKVARTAVEAATAITYGTVTLGGIRATVNDGDGRKYVLASYQAAVTSDLVNGALTQNASQTSMDICIGLDASALTPDDTTSLAKQYLAAQTETARIVAR